MPIVVPKLNLNKHPKDFQDYSLGGAFNMMINKDSALLCTENATKIHNVTDLLINELGNEFVIKYTTPCNNEIIFYIQTDDDNTLKLYRYNEQYNEIKFNGNIEYHGGSLQSTFTYNKDNLIVSIAEATEDVPLKILDLGSFNKIKIPNNYIQPICPEVRIPTCVATHVKGIAYKGWYHIFIRFKLNNNNYTQWFNTNESIFIDSFTNEFIEDYYVSKDNNPKPVINNKYYYRSTVETYLSSDGDFAKTSFTCKLNNIDNNFTTCQLGFIIVRKDSTKCYRTEDISCNNTYLFNRNSVVEESAINMINTYNNYFNVKTIDSYNNVLYIANYNEKYDEKDIEVQLRHIDVTINHTTLSHSSNVIDDIDINSYNKPNQLYNFYIHFVDKYGHVTDGFQINNFNHIHTSLDTHLINNCLLIKGDTINPFKITIDRLPNNYIGYFVSYEELELNVKYEGLAPYYNDNTISFWSDQLNIDDSINLNFNSINFYDINTRELIGVASITDTKLYPADSVNNIGRNTYLKITFNNNIINLKENTSYWCELYKELDNTFYSKKHKTLIPCSPTSYTTTNIINTNTAFITYDDYLRFGISLDTTNEIEGVYFNDGVMGFKRYNTENSDDFIYSVLVTPWVYTKFNSYKVLPTPSRIFNNKPAIKVFPIYGLSTSNENKKAYAPGCITEPKDMVDVYKQPNLPYYENYPKTLTNYIEDNTFSNNFPKTIRRSNVISDESEAIGWRFFESDNYKNIIENKGDIIKISSIGNMMLIHTQHSIFQFDCNTALQTIDNIEVSLNNTDIWNINYKEVITSELGYGGLAKPEHSIIGTFGYVFYEQDNQRIFRYDNGKLEQIDIDINNFIRNNTDDSNLNIVDDVKRNRLIFIFTNTTISYNYKYNVFVSTHATRETAYNTKCNIYYVSGNSITTYNEDKYVTYANCDIMINTNYPTNKMLEYITYKLNKITDGYNSHFFVNVRDNYYSGETLTICSEECTTGNLDISIENPRSTINSVKDYTKPYRELGMWNFNYIRNNPNLSPVKGLVSDDSTRLYGTWFAIGFCFTNITDANCVEIEFLECKFNKNLT